MGYLPLFGSPSSCSCCRRGCLTLLYSWPWGNMAWCQYSRLVHNWPPSSSGPNVSTLRLRRAFGRGAISVLVMMLLLCYGPDTHAKYIRFSLSLHNIPSCHSVNECFYLLMIPSSFSFASFLRFYSKFSFNTLLGSSLLCWHWLRLVPSLCLY